MFSSRNFAASLRINTDQPHTLHTPHSAFCILHSINSVYINNAVNGFYLIDQLLQRFHIHDLQHDSPFEEAFLVGVEHNVLHVDLQILGNDLGDFAQQAHDIAAINADGGLRTVCFDAIPLHLDDAIAVTLLQAFGIGAVGAMDTDGAFVGDKTKHTVARIGLQHLANL